MAQFLFEVQQKNRLQQKGLLRRFSISCYGHQETVEEMLAEKAEKFKELKDYKKKQRTEYEEWFLRYRPADDLSLKEKKKQERKLKKTKAANKKPNAKKTETKKRGRGGLFY
jgi:hypothetical protein